MSPRRNPFGPPAGRLSLYIHVPFCGRKCNYCAFNSSVPSYGEIDTWLELIAAELKLWHVGIGKAVLDTCYIGGGTPTVLNGPQWLKLAEIVDAYFDFSKDAEVTVEANPNSLGAEHLLLWRDWRVTRVSIGVQSLDDAELEQLGRLHTSRQAYDAVAASLASGFSVNADFMFGLPGQTFRNWSRTLRGALKTGIHHISLYQLSIEQGTPWEAMPPEKLSDGYAPYRFAQWYLPRKNYIQYEVANFAKSGHESRHNLNYWREGEYIGAGPGASGYIGGWRYKNAGVLSEYAGMLRDGKIPAVSGERLDDGSLAKEAAILALRTSIGITREEYVKKYGGNAEKRILEKMSLFSDDIYSVTDSRIFLTPKGMRVANRIWAELV